MNKIREAKTLREAIKVWFQEGKQGKVLGPQGKIIIRHCLTGCCNRGALISNLLGGLPLFSVLGDQSGDWKFCSENREEVLNEWNEQW